MRTTSQNTSNLINLENLPPLLSKFSMPYQPKEPDTSKLAKDYPLAFAIVHYDEEKCSIDEMRSIVHCDKQAFAKVKVEEYIDMFGEELEETEFTNIIYADELTLESLARISPHMLVLPPMDISSSSHLSSSITSENKKNKSTFNPKNLPLLSHFSMPYRPTKLDISELAGEHPLKFVIVHYDLVSKTCSIDEMRSISTGFAKIKRVTTRFEDDSEPGSNDLDEIEDDNTYLNIIPQNELTFESLVRISPYPLIILNPFSSSHLLSNVKAIMPSHGSNSTTTESKQPAISQSSSSSSSSTSSLISSLASSLPVLTSHVAPSHPVIASTQESLNLSSSPSSFLTSWEIVQHAAKILFEGDDTEKRLVPRK